MQFGMPTLIENRTLAENIALCKRLGLRFIELNMNFPEYQLDQLERGEVLDAAEAAGIYYTIHLDENLKGVKIEPCKWVWAKKNVGRIDVQPKRATLRSDPTQAARYTAENGGRNAAVFRVQPLPPSG